MFNQNIFSMGESGCFRNIEKLVPADLIVDNRLEVLGTGGGVVLREFNRTIMKNQSLVIYLRMSPEEIFKRTRKHKKSAVAGE